MADPQLEDGYTPIANEILEHLMRKHLSPNQWQVLLCIIRKTYGFHKKVDYIANSQIVEATGLGKTVVSRALGDLNDMQVIIRKGKYVGFQKDWEKWQELAKLLTLGSKLAELSTSEKLAEQLTELAELSTKVSSPRVTQNIKYTIQKKAHGEFKNVLLTDEDYQKLIERFGQLGAMEKIETLSSALASKGYKYKNHYATILSWDRRDKKQKSPARNITYEDVTHD